MYPVSAVFKHKQNAGQRPPHLVLAPRSSGRGAHSILYTASPPRHTSGRSFFLHASTIVLSRRLNLFLRAGTSAEEVLPLFIRNRCIINHNTRSRLATSRRRSVHPMLDGWPPTIFTASWLRRRLSGCISAMTCTWTPDFLRHIVNVRRRRCRCQSR